MNASPIAEVAAADSTSHTAPNAPPASNNQRTVAGARADEHAISAGALGLMVTKIPSVIAEFKPVLQVAKIERLFGGTWACLRLTLNDDSSSIHALTAVPDALRAASCLGGIGLAPGCLLRLLEYSVTDMGSRKVVCIRASKVVAGPRALIGSGVSESEVTVQATKRARGGVAHSRGAHTRATTGP